MARGGRGAAGDLLAVVGHGVDFSIGRWAPSAALHWMRRAARLCVAPLTLYFVRQRPDTKGAPPLYLTPFPNGPFPWRPPN